MDKKYVAAAAAASTLGGAVAGAALLAPGFAGAQDDTTDTTTPEAVEESTRPDPGERLTEALQPLVDDGTLTEAQLDAVVARLQEVGQELGPRGGHGPGRFGEGPFGGGADIAGVLGLEPEALREALADGQSIADIAADQGVDVQDVVDAIVTATEERLGEAVDAGRIDQERADEILADAPERAEDMVNGELEFAGPRGGHGFHGRFGPGGDDVDPDTGTDTDTADA